ncbi:MAG TPA: OmpA family protein [Burkholderiales bacterium]|nr:OmpA family protein [Burkholderiales bacterium]
MTIRLSKPIFVTATLATLGLAACASQEQSSTSSGTPVPYLIDQRGQLARSGAGLCWRTGYWTQKLAEEYKRAGAEFPIGCECEKDLMPKELCEPPPPPVAEAPPPEPEPEAAPPPPPPPPAPEHITLSADAFFDFNKADLRPRGEERLAELASRLQNAEYETVTVTGYTDRLGSPAYNQKLSEKRAQVVADYLVSHGVHAHKIEAVGKGESNPVTTPDQCKNLKRKQLIECLQPDRRVDVDVTAIVPEGQ